MNESRNTSVGVFSLILYCIVLGNTGLATTNQMLSLGGTNDTVITTFHTVTSAQQLIRFTVSAWVCCNQSTVNVKQVIVERGLMVPTMFSGDLVRYNFVLGLTTNKQPYVTYHGRNEFDISVSRSSVSLSSNEWNFLAGTYDGSHLSLFINGALMRRVATENIPYTGYDASPAFELAGRILIGANDKNPYSATNELDSYFQGLIDEVQVWDGALTQELIQSNMFRKPLGTETNLFGYWSFDDGTATDFSDNTNNGAFYSNATCSAAGIAYPAEPSLCQSSNFVLNFQSIEDTTYDIDSTTNLISPNWIDASTGNLGDGFQLSIIDTNNTETQKYYRIISY